MPAATQERPRAGRGLTEISRTGSAAARADLRAQIARLERRLGGLAFELGCAGRALPLPAQSPAGARGLAAPRVLSLGELENVRDGLVAQAEAAERAVRGCSEAEAKARWRLERMLDEPGEHRFEIVYGSELGVPGCGAYQVRPRLGLLGVLFDWWCVKLSSGCP